MHQRKRSLGNISVNVDEKLGRPKIGSSRAFENSADRHWKWKGYWGLKRLVLLILFFAGIPVASVLYIWQNWLAIAASILIFVLVSLVLSVLREISFYYEHR